ncbi:MAG: CDP-alcohol phosphatidyltransferase family protein [Candidatus Omnitrophica bacterium]|nr:CDP-alcohol phosphatidyltransferase family protein [Candidatus Omnitrophota bacterium]MCM8790812.1 CDP-alcohol phosphatidyltransferase family protein [Candidatus Omnitrophota bacterium]
MAAMNIPNKISIGRIILIPFFITAVAYSRLDIALIVFLIATVSDGIDGMLARALKQKTELGTILDPMADKLLLVSAYICLAVAGNIPAYLRMPPYVPIIIISRDVIIVLGSVIIYLIRGKLNVAPSVMGKITTFFQMITIVSILARFEYSYVMWSFTVLMTIASGIDYVIKGSRALSENNGIRKVS